MGTAMDTRQLRYMTQLLLLTWRSLATAGYGYAAPAQAGTTIIIVMPAPGHRARSMYAAPQVYTAPPVTTGYYGAVSQPIYAYAPGNGYSYTPGYWNRGYWGRYGYGWR